MRPTFSIIFFTVISGAGYGLLFLIGFALATGLSLIPHDRWIMDGPHETVDPRVGMLILLAVGVLLASAGLLASIGHLGQPLRSWRAFSQWRSSWLSREGVAALATYVPIIVIVWMIWPRADPYSATTLRVCGALLAACSAVTVICTAHIYSSLKPIRAWHNAYVLPGYLLLGIYSGALTLGAVCTLLPATVAPTHVWYASVMELNFWFGAPCCVLLKWLYWRFLESPVDRSTIGSATGLDRFGTVRSSEQPHTEENYLTHEMGFVVARKHSRRLRALAFWAILLGPVVISVVTMLITLLAGFPLALSLVWLASWTGLLLGVTGVFIERWLFFAEAKHVVTLYYGAASA